MRGPAILILGEISHPFCQLEETLMILESDNESFGYSS